MKANGAVPDVAKNNLLLASSLFLSGNNYAKIRLFSRFLNLRFISESTFYRLQQLYICPSVLEQRDETGQQVLSGIGDQHVIACGDGRNDSPGFACTV